MAMTRKQPVNRRCQRFYKALLLTLSLYVLVKGTASMRMEFPICPPMERAAILKECETHEPSHCGGRTYCLRGIGEECFQDDVRYLCKKGLKCECNRCQNCDKNKCFLEMCPHYNFLPSKRFMRQRSYPYNTYDDAY